MFFVLNCFTYFSEKYLVESTAETISIQLGIMTLISIITFNRNSFSDLSKLYQRVTARVGLVSVMVFVCWASAFYFNWYVFYSWFGITNY
ncbi:MAG: hypothetical protein HZB41_05310 [Ignavibacteriae bacterium]|nr:hypothetical protein [Ignavibacteriota bacterium]